jgi:MFS transporter, MHS family, proline/betaine transporter
MKNQNKNIIGALSGNFLEYYDVTLYGFFAAFLGPVFFPAQDPYVSTLMTLSAFAISFLARPFGGMFFGYMGDRLGRKKALSLAVLLVTIPTFAIGVMPSYESIGVTAPIAIVLCRFLQGLCTGGEYPGVAVFIAEHSGRRKKALFCSMVPASSLLGAITGTLIGAFFLQTSMPDWGWRVPFLFGGVLGLTAYFLRRQINETQAFEELSMSNTLSKNPILETLKKSKTLVLGSALIGAGTLVPFYMIFVYMAGFMEHTGVILSDTQKLLMSSGLMFLIMLSIPVAGALADRYGNEKIMFWSCVLMAVIAYPFFALSYHANSVNVLFFSQAVIAVTSAGFVAPTVSYFTSLFPAKNRYSAMGFSVSLGEGVGGGTTPLIATFLVHVTHNPLSPALYLAGISVISILGLFVIARAQGRDLNLQKNLL